MEMNWDGAWQQLVYEHSPFKAIDDDDFQSLLRQLSELERLFLTCRRWCRIRRLSTTQPATARSGERAEGAHHTKP
jgi:hypothetical protein